MPSPTILQSNFFMYLVLPFLLIFTIVFAILEKTEILGKGKKQVDALVALAVGLIVVAFSSYVQIIAQLTAFLGVALVIVLVFMILTGAFYEQGSFKFEPWAKMTAMAIVFLAVVIAVLIYTGAWNYLRTTFSGSGNTLVTNVIFIVIIVVVVVVFMVSGSKKDSDSGKKDS